MQGGVTDSDSIFKLQRRSKQACRQRCFVKRLATGMVLSLCHCNNSVISPRAGSSGSIIRACDMREGGCGVGKGGNPKACKAGLFQEKRLAQCFYPNWNKEEDLRKFETFFIESIKKTKSENPTAETPPKMKRNQKPCHSRLRSHRPVCART